MIIHKPFRVSTFPGKAHDPGVYFVTLCTLDRVPLFGEINNDEMHCNPFGAIVWDVWKSLPACYPQISIDTAIVMPDHFHGIIAIHENEHRRGDSREFCVPERFLREGRIAPNREVHRDLGIPERSKWDEPPLQPPQPRRRMTISLIIGYLKMNTAKRINELRNSPGVPIWQRNYFDKILRDDLDYDSLSEYIVTNPQRWGIDQD